MIHPRDESILRNDLLKAEVAKAHIMQVSVETVRELLKEVDELRLIAAAEGAKK